MLARFVLPAVALALLSSAANAARLAVVGVADVDGDTTRIVAIDLDDAAQPLHDVGVLTHAAGDTPTGVLVDDRRLAYVLPDDGTLILRDLRDGSDRALFSGAQKNQRPLVVGGHVYAVRADGAEHFAVVRAALETPSTAPFDVVGRLRAGWLAPVAGSDGVVRLLAFDEGGKHDGFRLLLLDGDRLRSDHWLGVGTFRRAVARADHTILIERENVVDGRARSTLLALTHAGEKAITTGLPGLSPVVVDKVAAAASGDKDGSIVVDVGDGSGFGRWPGARVGVARPQALTSDGAVVVVVVDRGQALPAELWALTKQGGRALLPAKPRQVVTVYGISGGWR